MRTATLSKLPLPNTSPHRRELDAIAPRRRELLHCPLSAIDIRPHPAARFINCSCPIHSGCGYATLMHPEIHLGCASSFRCQRTAVSRRSSSDRLVVFRPSTRAETGESCPGPMSARHEKWEMLVSPFVVVAYPAPPVSTRTASRLPCRHAAALPHAPTQAPLPDFGISSTCVTVAGTGHHSGRQSPSPVRISLHLIGHVAGPGNIAYVSPVCDVHNADHPPASARLVCLRSRLRERFRGTNLEDPLTLSAGRSIAVWHRLRSNLPRSGFPPFAVELFTIHDLTWNAEACHRSGRQHRCRRAPCPGLR